MFLSISPINTAEWPGSASCNFWNMAGVWWILR